MPHVVNLASKYSPKVDERFYAESQALLGTNQDYDWEGVDTIKVYQVDVVAMNDYSRTGTNRYGTPNELGNSVQTMKLRKDRSFTFTIDKANRNQTMMVMEAGKSLARQEREVVIPEFDRYVYAQQVGAAVENGAYEIEAASSTTAYAKFLKGGERLGNKHVPGKGRVAYCSYAYANLLMLDPAFVKYGDRSQEMVQRGELGECDGTKVLKVASDQLPAGVSYLLVHPSATVAPQQLKEYKTHQDPPGLNGDLVEGRHLYDAFVLDAKVDALYVGFFGDELVSIPAELGEDGKVVIPNIDHFAGGEFKILAGTTLPAYGDADTSYTAFNPAEDTVSADSILAYCVGGKIIAATLIDVA